MFKLSLGWTAILILLAFSFTSCDDDDDTPQVLDPGTITEVAAGDDRFETLVSALQRTGLDDVLNGSANEFTVFAPTDDAFDALGVDLSTLSDDALRDILLYHVTAVKLTAADIPEGDNFIQTATDNGPDGEALTLLANKTGTAVTVNGSSSVVVADVEASNGVIHAIDEVLMPQSIVDFTVNAGGTSELEGAVVATDLVDALNGDGPLTVFAPTNAAFQAISDVTAGLTTDQLRNILLAHVVSGNVTSDELSEILVQTLNDDYSVDITSDGTNFQITQTDGSTVNLVLTDIQAKNGVIHLIDAVLVP